jgi:hypothetical protein
MAGFSGPEPQTRGETQCDGTSRLPVRAGGHGRKSSFVAQKPKGWAAVASFRIATPRTLGFIVAGSALGMGVRCAPGFWGRPRGRSGAVIARNCGAGL